MTDEESRERARQRYLNRSPEQKARYTAVARERREMERQEHIAARAARGLAPYQHKAPRSEQEQREYDRARHAAWRQANLEKDRERHRLLKRRHANEDAIAEGREPLSLSRPKAMPQTEEEKREKRRLKAQAWRAKNLERAREIARESMKRAAAQRAIADGREPGKAGRPRLFTEPEKRAKRKAKSEKWNVAHLEETRKYARERGQAVRDGTFVSRALPRLTEEARKLRGRQDFHKRRAHIKANGGSWTKADIDRIYAEQNGLCAICNKPFGPDGYHIDHWKPLSCGGANDPSNLKLTHPVCNMRKGAKTLAELGPLLVEKPTHTGD